MTEYNYEVVNPDDLKTSVQYCNALVSAVISLQTLERVEIRAYKEGLLDDPECESSKTIIWEIKRLIGLYKAQLDLIVARMPEYDQEEVLEWMKTKTQK